MTRPTVAQVAALEGLLAQRQGELAGTRALLARSERDRDDAQRVRDVATQLEVTAQRCLSETVARLEAEVAHRQQVSGRLHQAERDRDAAIESLALEQRAHGTAQARSAREANKLRERLSDALTLLDEARAHIRDLSPLVRWDDVARAALEDPGAGCLCSSADAGGAVSGGDLRNVGGNHG